ncbi:Alpha/Beta hydrolase protein [Aspergillus egyptiacus]|nr:Alpha/Beta hydrolase protein [Aspergillus egyptiacus]
MIFLLRALRILKDALFSPFLPLTTRLHLLTLQPITLLTYTIEWIQTKPRQTHKAKAKAPLHLNIHGGALLSGLPEGNARFCSQLAEKSGAVVVSSTSYRYVHVHGLPDAHEDVQDVAAWLSLNAERRWNADPKLLTVSGFSAGGDLALAVAQGVAGTEVAVKGSVTFYGVADLRLPPWQKPKPDGYPTKDHLAFLQPLFDAYAGPNRVRDMENPLLHPTLARIETLPRNMMFVVESADILYEEPVAMTRRLEEEAKAINPGGRLPEQPDGEATVVRTNVFEGQIHGWSELPSPAIDVSKRTKVLGDAIAFLSAVYRSSIWIHSCRLK